MPLSRSRDYLSIGEVLESLQADFPDVTISKIRFLETEGLVAPKRTPSGYRMFFESDLDRLRYVLSLQRDHFLPLKVIRDRLAEYDSNGGKATVTPLQPPPARKSKKPAGNGGGEATVIEMSGVQMTRAELLKASGLTETQLASLDDYGIVGPCEAGNYDETVLAAARAAKRFFDYGVEAR